MTEAGTPAADSFHAADPAAPIDALRARGAERFDPSGFRFIEALARRRAAHGGHARRVLDCSLAKAVAEYGERFDRAEREARTALTRGAARFPEAANGLSELCDGGDFGGLHRQLARLEAQEDRGPLAELLAELAALACDGAGDASGRAVGAAGASPGELRSASRFRSTWSRLSVDRQLSHAFAQAPANAGPLNSHFLVLQSLRLMRDVSPQYIEQFLSYADALLWLEQAESVRAPAPKSARSTRKARAGGGQAA